MPSIFASEFKAADTRVARRVSGAISVAAQLGLGAAVVLISTVVTTPRVADAPLVAPHLVRAVFLPATLIVERPAPAAPRVKAVEEVKLPEPAPERAPLIAMRELENKALPAPTASEVRPVDIA